MLALVVLVLLCLMTWRMAPPPPAPDPTLLAELAQARAERDAASAQLAVRTGELHAASETLVTRTNDLRAITHQLDQRTAELAAATEAARALTEELQCAQELVRERASERDRYSDWLRDLYGRCEQIYRQLKDVPQRFPRVLFEESIFTIERDGTMIAKQTVLQQPVEKLQMILRQFGSDVPTASVQDLQITPQASRLNGSDQRVVLLPAVDEDRVKKVLLVFLPEVPANTKLQYTFTWRWERFWLRLLETGKDTWEVPLPSTAPIPRVAFRFRLAPALAPAFPRLRVENLGQGGGTSEDTVVDGEGYTVYTWVAHDVPPGTTMKLQLARDSSF